MYNFHSGFKKNGTASNKAYWTFLHLPQSLICVMPIAGTIVMEDLNVYRFGYPIKRGIAQQSYESATGQRIVWKEKK